ncbi:hypothetical protein C479_07051 [Halovivax asiaticus JCM 14624]|uniref:Uncharacterized protein n=1 Tax=Halovivax asiaticus JCM 14624 TaxID=1227490 RepID=M0BL39_9EURY|nr:hypothetical protein [Halovivax asiaticus]ELZ11601.1 hypothetical protein C479_07051 [Halovivax asiaticus JCM 14624]
MPDDVTTTVEDALDCAADLPTQEAVSHLRSAAAALESARKRDAIDAETADALTTRLSQRIRAIEERDAYDAELGAALNLDEEDAA